MATIISSHGASRPAPKWWRNFERGMLLIIIPAVTAIIQSGIFPDVNLTLKINLIVNTGVVAIIKFIGMMLVDTEDNYVSNLTQSDQNKVEINIPPVEPKT